MKIIRKEKKLKNMLETRISIISDKLEKNGNVEVKQLADELGVTEKTIRHDLSKMEKLGILKRVHGGAVSTIRKAEDAYINPSRTVSLSAKEKIARTAYAYFQSIGTDRKIIYIDASTTNYEFARLLRNVSSTIVTNDLLIASYLSVSSTLTLHITGGQLYNNVNKYLVGPDAIDMIQRHHADLCFIGASAISKEDGLMTFNNTDAKIKQAMIKQSDSFICLADQSKFGRKSFIQFAKLEDLDLLITDSISSQQKEQLSKAGVEVLVSEE